ncbi:GDP-mannose 4,6-dehydratase [Herbaspirillum sp. alder98]|uniref:GDP-mannose 4,6-dehydratase n=1 Tax=Herbaspirillum sp. alder98 TaxID=2913096 RepID=UPI001CD8C778|nr:GDP-mannose 4,6-dehydratase [Herbaspirillum sp. alder98]MCA1326252.1 GDP-mannose 4,6-dehydratase [Herbaspirillum sp. alder98]
MVTTPTPITNDDSVRELDATEKQSMTVAQTKTALITGIAGQDGAYLAQLLSEQGYRVVGTSHRPVDDRSPVPAALKVLQLDLSDTRAVTDVVAALQPDEIYNLAARASSAQLFDEPLETAEINGLSAVRFLDAIRQHSPHTRFCQAASSEVFAGAHSSPQDETTALAPVNSYGAAKAYAVHMVRMYRKHYGLHASSAFLFNHESPRRGIHFVTRKITRTVALIATGQADHLELGDLDSRRDWGYAGDVVVALWKMLQQPAGDDYVIATGKSHSVRDFCRIAFAHVGLDYTQYVRSNPAFITRHEAVALVGNQDKARLQLGWQATIDFQQLVTMMVDADLALLKQTK